MQEAALEYIPRNPQATVLYRVVAEQLETFLARQEERERPVPPFVEREFRDYLTCGVLAARGFIRGRLALNQTRLHRYRASIKTRSSS
jgi:hypothetical protein